MAEDVIKLGLFNRDAAIIVAEGKGFLKQEDIRVEINTVTDSPTLLRNLIKGNYDLILNNADNVIAWAEGQGEDPQKNDFVIFLGGSQGVDQKLVVAPGINDFGGLKGKVFAVDAPTTGYAIVGVYIMKKHGLEWNRDYTFKSFGNTTARADAMSRGDASGAMMSMPDDDIQKRGFKVLAKSEDYVKHYARGLGATRRDWANAHEDLVVRFTRAMIRTTDWVQDPKNKDEAIQLLLSETKNNKARAETMYAQTISPTMGLTPRSRIDLEGIRTVLELREVAGLMKPPVPKPGKYVDERFYKKALSTLVK
ncbi:MAG TPA: ABC transporter substrate-binding protein [Candidatus Binatia bacterium]|jgi:ABC-type nitrate/sulfonate/bicarbonate transport system substrate-binding protein|nr:ABC transporter substrate-binding protein [Candidatus Binatia bacterium]